MTAAQREYALDRAVSQTDQSLVDDCDGALLLKLERAWWTAHRAEFALAFEEASSPQEWAGIARAKEAALTEWLANEIRDGLATGSVALPDAFLEDEAA